MKVTIGDPSVNVGINPKSVGINPGSQIARYVIEPYVSVEEVADGAIITCTSQGQTTTGEIYNGKDGKDGKDGATDYKDLDNKPQINSVTLSGNKSLHDLGIAAESDIPTVPVQSVNSKTGDVVLTASDVGAMPDNYTAPVSSVNSKTGAVTLSASDVGALPDSIDVDQVKQVRPADPSQYSYWRPLTVGASSNQSESGAFADQTGKLYVFDAIKAQPSTGTIKATKFKGNVEGDVTGTASGNYVLPQDGIPASDLEDNYAASHSAGGAAELTVAIPYGEIDSTSTSTVLTATVPGIWQLKDGVCCYIRNDIVSSATGCTLNINGLGAMPMYNSSADAGRVTSGFTAAQTWLFIYNEKRVDGGCWDMYQGQVNSNTIGYQLRTNSLTLPSATYCGRYRLLFTSADGTKLVPANADSQTSAAKTHTTSTTPIDPFGEIFYYGSTAVKQANESPAATVLWQQYVVTLGYSFNNANAALALTSFKPVYITATPQSDGSAVLDYFTQDRPTTQDGKIYIFLGIAVSATTVEMTMKHPIYYHDGTRCRIWNG